MGDRRKQTGSRKRKEVMGGRGRESYGKSVMCTCFTVGTDSEFTGSKINVCIFAS